MNAKSMQAIQRAKAVKAVQGKAIKAAAPKRAPRLTLAQQAEIVGKAHALGRAAFSRGEQCKPAADKDLAVLMGEWVANNELYIVWERGWNAAMAAK